MRLLNFIVVFLCAGISFLCPLLAQENLSQVKQVEGKAEPVLVDPLEKIAGLTNSVVVMELYTSQACVFCPKADTFMQQFALAPNVISFSCHVDYFDVKTGSLSIPACSKRQEFYESILKEGPKFTPQMMINGTHSLVGYRHADVWKKLDLASATPVKMLNIVSSGKQGVFEVNMPEFIHGEYNISLIEYVSEKSVKVAEGANRGKTIKYVHVVKAITDMGAWNGEEKVFPFTQSALSAGQGFAVLAQDLKTGKIVAAAQYKNPADTQVNATP